MLAKNIPESESEADAGREGVVADVLDILGEIVGALVSDKLTVFLQFVANGQRQAFLVNLNFVVSLSGRPSTGCSLQMFQVEKPIPVSRSYTKDIHDRLNRWYSAQASSTPSIL